MLIADFHSVIVSIQVSGPRQTYLSIWFITRRKPVPC